MKSYHHGNLKKELISCASKICERDGYTKLSIRSLAKESNVSQTAPYRRFKTKEDLYAAIAQTGFDKLYKAISKSKSQTGNFASSPGKEWTFELLPSLDKNATLETQFSATEPGAYRVKSVVKDANDIPIGSSETGWTSNPHLVEFKNLEANEQWMKTVSESTGGSIVELKDLSTIEDNLIKSDLPETITKSVPIWHNSWILLIALTLLLLEWSTRRIRGLA